MKITLTIMGFFKEKKENRDGFVIEYQRDSWVSWERRQNIFSGLFQTEGIS